MGRGIAQVSVQAGSTVRLFDSAPGAAELAAAAIREQWEKMIQKGKLEQETASGFAERLQTAD